MEFHVLDGMLILLTCAVCISVVFKRLRLPSVLGYLFVGLLVGPYGLGLIPDTESTHELAEFGVVFLMFTIGLEFSLSHFLAMKRTVLGLGGLQMALCTALTFGVAKALHMETAGAMALGGILSLSSTAIVIKLLNDQMELTSQHGHNAVGILLFQDIAVIPFLILIPSYVDPTVANSTLLLMALVKGLIAMFSILVFGRWILRPVFHEVASAHSLELFTLSVLLVTLSCAWLTMHMGLSMALGAFLGGMMLGETKYRHQVEAEIRPFRDVLLGLFFITIGMLLNLRTLPNTWHWALLLLALMVVFKALIITILSICFGSSRSTSVRTGLILAQGGEFGFALLTLSINHNVLTENQGQVILAALLFSMALTSFVIRFNKQISRCFLPKGTEVDAAETQAHIAEGAAQLENHIILCGYGRVGQNLMRLLESNNFESIALDLDPTRVQQAQLAGDRVCYGDSANIDILYAAGLEKAKALVLSFNDVPASIKITSQVRPLFPDLPILVRTADDGSLKKFQELGATEVVPETLEASLMIGSHLLFLLGVPHKGVLRQIQEVRNTRYSLLQQIFPSREEFEVEPETERRLLHAVSLVQNAHAVGKTIGDFCFAKYNVQVTAVRREGIRGLNPEPDMALKEDDVLVLYGLPGDIEHVEKILLGGG